LVLAAPATPGGQACAPSQPEAWPVAGQDLVPLAGRSPPPLVSPRAARRPH
jgi:hypothetical protein